MNIKNIIGREILDSRGNPTVEVDVILDNGVIGRACVPSGASTGEREALEMRDGDKNRFNGKGVLNAVNNVNTILRDNLIGMDVTKQKEIDYMMLELDGTKTKSKLGANAILGVSMACLKVAAKASGKELYENVGDGRTLPVPMMNIINGGAHADNSLDFQEYMIIPQRDTIHDRVRVGVEVFHSLKNVLKEKGYVTSVGDEGGFAPNLKTNKEGFELITEAVKRAGYEPGKDIGIAIDAAASELYDGEKDGYYFPGESKMTGKEVIRDSNEMIRYYENLLDEFPVVSIEDGLQEDDWEGWKAMTERIGSRVQLVGDDLFVTNIKRLSCGIKLGTANAILIKVNQIGTLTESLEAVELAARAGYRSVISHRSGETEDSFIADLAVATGAGQIKTGAPCRSDRNAKYNQLLRIHEQLGRLSVYENPFVSAHREACYWSGHEH